MTCDKSAEYWDLNSIWEFSSSSKVKRPLFMSYMIFYRFDCIKSFFLSIFSLTAENSIETFVFCDLIIENLDEHDFNDLFFKMNTKTKHNEIDLFERGNKWSYRSRRDEKRISKHCKRKNRRDRHVDKRDCWRWKK